MSRIRDALSKIEGEVRPLAPEPYAPAPYEAPVYAPDPYAPAGSSAGPRSATINPSSSGR